MGQLWLKDPLAILAQDAGGGIVERVDFNQADWADARVELLNGETIWLADLPIAPEDIAKTVYYAMGIDDLTAFDKGGRPYNLMEEGHPITELF